MKSPVSPLKLAKTILSPDLSYIFNISLLQGKFPNLWKQSGRRACFQGR
jgi:hypothetical protein